MCFPCFPIKTDLSLHFDRGFPACHVWFRVYTWFGSGSCCHSGPGPRCLGLGSLFWWRCRWWRCCIPEESSSEEMSRKRCMQPSHLGYGWLWLWLRDTQNGSKWMATNPGFFGNMVKHQAAKMTRFLGTARVGNRQVCQKAFDGFWPDLKLCKSRKSLCKK